MIIDFSATDKFTFCPAAWYESYQNRRRLKWPKAQRKDALCLGSLVHEGLRVWQQSHVVQIPDTVVEEVTPDRETYNLALELVYGYSQTYPEERWPLVMCEEPVTWPLLMSGKEYPQSEDEPYEILTGLAKIDSYFYVPELTQLESGVPGQLVTLEPGWWIHEYKTKSSDIPLGIYMQGWEMGMQASFQVMALQERMNTTRVVAPQEVAGLAHSHQVNGVLVNVLEKPRRHIPKRKCQTCQEYYEFYSWVPMSGEYACPVCGTRQRLQPLKMDTPTRPPSYYRFVVTRTPQQLAQHREMIIGIGQAMIHMEQNGLYSVPWHTRNCVDTKWKKACDYFAPHKNGTSTLDLPEFEEVPDYRGLVNINV